MPRYFHLTAYTNSETGEGQVEGKSNVASFVQPTTDPDAYAQGFLHALRFMGGDGELHHEQG
jgi:hypothetical protein